MKFAEAFKLMKDGAKIKLPSWGGYWTWDEEKQTILMHTKDGKVLDIRETKVVEYTMMNVASEEWMYANEENTPVLGGVATFGFDTAIRYLKRGLKVARKGWNGKDQYIELAKEISYLTPDGWKGTGVVHMDIGSQAIVFVGTRGRQIGWLASQSDMLAEDWVLVD